MRFISRRDFLRGSMAAVAVTGLSGISYAFAEEATASKKQEFIVNAVIEADAVVVGCGAAGIHAALTLAAAGKKTVVLEKGATCGTANGSVAGGPALAETRVQKEEGAVVPIEQLYRFEYEFSRGTVNGSLLRKCTDQGERVVSHFMDNGVEMKLMNDSYGVGFRARHRFSTSGTNRFQPLVDRFIADGGEIYYNSEAVQLVKTGDAVTGVLAKSMENGKITQFNAKAVLIATGGYAGNAERLKKIYGDIEIWPLCNTLSTGQGFDMVIEAGGIADRNWALCCNEFGGANHKIPDRPGAAMAFANQAQKFAVYGGLIVNSNGDRFMNEQYLTDRPLALGGEMSLREGKYYAVVDQEMLEACRDVGILEYYNNPQEWYVGQTGLAGIKISKIDGDALAAVKQGWGARGTLAECSEVFGLNNLEETVAKYNTLCDSGKDTQFYKSSYLLHRLNGDTYYVFEYEPSIWSTFGGAKTDDYCRALTPDQNIIPGLYVAGVDNGSLYCSPYYENEGASLGIAYTSGIVAADCMIEYLST